MSAAPVTEAHKRLVATIVERAFRFAERNHKITPELSQLIANSEARATYQLRQQVANLTHSNDSHRETAETWRAAAIERDQLRADRTYNHECINRLATATGTLGEKSEKVVEVALSTIAELRAELDSIKQEIEMVEHRAYRAEAKISNQSERIRYLEGATNHATGTPLSQAIARAESAEREAFDWKKIARYETARAERAELRIKQLEELK